MGADPPHGTGPGELSSRGRKVDNGDTAKDTGGGCKYPLLAAVMEEAGFEEIGVYILKR